MINRNEIIAVLDKWNQKLNGQARNVVGPYTTNGRGEADFALEIPLTQLWAFDPKQYGWYDVVAKDYPVICYVWENGHVELGEDGPDGEYLYGTVMDVDSAADLYKIS